MSVETKKKTILLDQLDKQIIRELQTDTRRSNRQISKKLGTSEGTIRNRTRRLQKDNLLKLHASLILPSLGFNFSCFIGLNIDLNMLLTIEKELTKIPNVLFVANITGQLNLMLMATFRSMEEYRDFMRDVIFKTPGIITADTFFNWNIVKNSWTDGSDILDIL
jgi:Lrp/AsnC family transcriptional regulator, regulator for asnA, asnC and gidA